MATTTRKPTTKVDTQPESKIPENVDLNMLIPVKNGYHGVLSYISPRTREEFVWDDFGDEQDMELKELRSAKSTNKAFFENNYFMFDGEYEWVIDFLGVRKFYEHAVGMDGFEKIFYSTPAQIKKTISQMSDGQKKSLVYCAKDKIASGEVDSFKIISALEEALGVALIQK